MFTEYRNASAVSCNDVCHGVSEILQEVWGQLNGAEDIAQNGPLSKFAMCIKMLGWDWVAPNRVRLTKKDGDVMIAQIPLDNEARGVFKNELQYALKLCQYNPPYIFIPYTHIVSDITAI